MLHIATSRPIGERCIDWAKFQGYELVPMEECRVFVSVMYDQLITDGFIGSRRCYNFHPGVLPEYRGSGAFTWAILNGETESGITLHEIDQGIDTGKIIDIRKFPILPDDNAGRVFHKGMDTIYEMFKDWLPRIIDGHYSTKEQGEGTTRHRWELKRHMDLTRQVRAFEIAGKGGAYYYNRRGEKIPLKYDS